jgi:MFS family permease
MKKLWNKNFILLLQGSAISTIGDLMYSVAIGYWVYEMTGSESLLGIMSSISMFVTMFLSPFSGSIVDKCPRKWVLVIGDTLQGILMITVGVFAYLGKLGVTGILVAAFLAALGGVFYAPAANTVLIDIIPRDDMVRGQSLFSGINSTINTVGTAFSGVMVAFFGVPLIIIINGLSNLYSAVSELFISVPKTTREGEVVTLKGILKDSQIALKTVLSEPCLKVFIPCAVVLNFLCSGAYTLMIPFTAEKGFSLEQYGLLMSVNTIGSLVCVILLGIFKLSPRTRFWIMALGFSTSVVCSLIMFSCTEFLPMCIFAFLSAFLNCAGNAVFSAAAILALPEDNRGAILGLFSSASIGGSALSALAYGFMGEIFPLQIVFSVGCILSFLPMLYLCFNPKVKTFILSH